ncbi:unnamed protein product [Mesocestoides corti]|uniref:Exoribonuclease phosphorolytic domain-containing protein n=1 Tax=Mesocestoides corti TaxID=53468 RepID=A0A0R3UNT4_MESCO|nr:unnamed protein product [Mesocestoides corti]
MLSLFSVFHIYVNRTYLIKIDLIDFCLDVNPSADGSAYLEYGNIKVICSVCGPVEVCQSSLIPNFFKFAPFSTQIRRDGVRDPEEKRLSQLLLSALEPSLVLDSFLRGKYQITVTVLDDGSSPGSQLSSTASCLSAGITCASIALVRAGVQMYDLAIGLDVDTSTLNPEVKEHGTSSVAIMPQLRQITMINSTWLELASVENLQKILDDSFDKAEEMYRCLQSLLFSSLEDEFKLIENN